MVDEIDTNTMTNKIHIDPEVKELRDLFDGLLGNYNPEQSMSQHLEPFAERLLAGHSLKESGIRFIVAQKLGVYDLEALFAMDFTLDDAKLCIAKEHGYEHWEAVEQEMARLDVSYEQLVDQMLAGDIEALKDAVSQNPAIVHQPSCFPHKATLLHYTGSNGVEGYRQVVPLNLAEIVGFLLETGSDHTLQANIYGGCTARELLVTSKHPYASGVIEVVQSVYEKHQGNESSQDN